jgi:hypothetical protein
LKIQDAEGFTLPLEWGSRASGVEAEGEPGVVVRFGTREFLVGFWSNKRLLHEQLLPRARER